MPYGGLRFTVTPSFWLRKVVHLPLFVESHNPSFAITVERFAEEPAHETWPDKEIVIQIKFADDTETSRSFPVPNLKIGEHTTLNLDHIFTAYPGQTIIRLPISVFRDRWETLYSYHVWREEAIWFAAWATLVTLATLGTGIAGILVALGDSGKP